MRTRLRDEREWDSSNCSKSQTFSEGVQVEHAATAATGNKYSPVVVPCVIDFRNIDKAFLCARSLPVSHYCKATRWHLIDSQRVPNTVASSCSRPRPMQLPAVRSKQVERPNSEALSMLAQP